MHLWIIKPLHIIMTIHIIIPHIFFSVRCEIWPGYVFDGLCEIHPLITCRYQSLQKEWIQVQSELLAQSSVLRAEMSAAQLERTKLEGDLNSLKEQNQQTDLNYVRLSGQYQVWEPLNTFSQHRKKNRVGCGIQRVCLKNTGKLHVILMLNAHLLFSS